MAKVKESVTGKLDKKKISRPGRHSKKKSSNLKSSKNYVKRKIGQGK